MPEPEQPPVDPSSNPIAQQISADAEALGLPSTLPTTETAVTPVANSQAGLASARVRLGGPLPDINPSYGHNLGGASARPISESQSWYRSPYDPAVSSTGREVVDQAANIAKSQLEEAGAPEGAQPPK